MQSPGPLVFLCYLTLIKYFPQYSISIYPQKQTVAVILATFAFTMLGFLAAVIALMFTATKSQAFNMYNKRGYLETFFFVYYMVIISLIITFLLSIFSLAVSFEPWLLRVAVMSTINNLVQIVLVTFIIVNMVDKAISKNE